MVILKRKKERIIFFVGDLAVAERSAQIQEKKRMEAEKKAKEEEREREKLLSEMIVLKSGIIEKENRVKKEEKERIDAIALANSLSLKVEALQVSTCILCTVFFLTLTFCFFENNSNKCVLNSTA